MSATDVNFGIQRYSGALIQSVDTTAKIDKKELRGSDGNVARVHAYNPTTQFSVKGHGAVTVVPGIGSIGVTSISGGLTLIEEFKLSDKNDDFQGWEFSGINYPNAQSV
jgi:hypothetical protein